MVTLMANAANNTLQSWKTKIEYNGGSYADIEVDEDLRSVASFIISQASFGSNYSETEMIVSKIRALQDVMSKANIGVPGSRYISIKGSNLAP